MYVVTLVGDFCSCMKLLTSSTLALLIRQTTSRLPPSPLEKAFCCIFAYPIEQNQFRSVGLSIQQIKKARIKGKILLFLLSFFSSVDMSTSLTRYAFSSD